MGFWCTMTDLTPPRYSLWTEKPALDQTLKQLLTEGYSFSTIANRLSSMAGQTISRVAAIGRANRQGFHAPPREAAPLKRQSLSAPSFARAVTRTKAAAVPPLPTSAAAFTKTLLELGPNDCRYPDPANDVEFWFCDQAAIKGSPYCEQHSKLCYTRG